MFLVSVQGQLFFPTRVGNKFVYIFQWTQTGGGGTGGNRYNIVVNTSKDTIINSKRYFFFNYIGNVGGNSYVRVDSITGSLYKYTGTNSCPYYFNETLIDSLLITGGTATQNCTYYNFIEMDTVTLFGFHTQKKIFYNYAGGSNGSEYFRCYNSKFGLYYYSYSAYGHLNSYHESGTLAGCILNDTLYGDTTFLPPTITHTPLGNTYQLNGVRNVNCVIGYTYPIVPNLTKLFFAKNSSVFDSVALTNTSGNNWTGNIILNGPGNYRYYLRTADICNQVIKLPYGAPASYFSFYSMIDSIIPSLTHTPIGPTPKVDWPAFVQATAIDTNGIDSVWIEWNKNSSLLSKQFKLFKIGGNIYNGYFDSEVSYGDSIYYVLKAVDGSPNHNIARLPLTGYYKFPIFKQKICESFSDTTFPPKGWFRNSGNSTWTYHSISGYGMDSGSARYNFFNINSGTTGQLISFAIDSTLEGDSLRLDIAHAYRNSSNTDILRIECFSSTNSWTLIKELKSGLDFISDSCLSTASSQNLFVPTSSQWKTRILKLPAGTKRFRFLTISGNGNDLFIDNICQINRAVGIKRINNFIPETYLLEQNYPNPFNPITKIRFALREEGKGKKEETRLIIYDILGKEVQTLVNEQLSPGMYEVTFDGTGLASGIYFYQLRTEKFVETKKLVLLK
jgi:hypothetical protein